MAKINPDILRDFLLESFDALSSISEELTNYEKNLKDKELLNSIFRKVHTLKGSSSFLGLKKIQEITHSAESILDLIREDVISLNSEMIDVFLECFDACNELLKNIEMNGEETTKDYSSIVNKFSAILEKCASKPIGIKGEDTRIHEELLNQKTIEKLTITEEVMTMKQNEKEMTKPQASEVEPSVEPEAAARANGVTDSVVRVNVHLLDKIMNIVGELVLNRNQILQYANIIDSSELNRLAQQLNIITSELQNDVMTTRMQPVGSVLSKFERIVRDLSRTQNKQVKLDIFGKDTELDKTLLEAIRDPLTHLIRNSIDHGIEIPSVRKSRGKNEEGKIQIKSYHEGGQVTIEIMDDGNGIDPQKIMNKAIQKGILTQDQVSKMSTRQILNIIFMPGFSTAEQVTNISGRGVGMDVVKSNIEKIGGSVDIISNVGEGTTFKLKIPLTLAIVPALVIQDGKETFAIPQISLVELVRLEGDEIKDKLEFLHDAEFFRLRGNLIPIFRLSACLKIESNKTERVYDSANIVILNAEGRVYGLIVDAILDTEEIVVKPLSKKLKKLTLFAGATIMGDGRVALIIDALGFFNSVDREHGQKADSILVTEQDVKDYASENQEVLLCSLGDNRNYAIPLVLVNRLEEFKSNQVEWTGEQALIKYGNTPMPLINLEKSLKLKGNSILDSVKDTEDTTIPCVVVKIRDQVYGLIVDEIKDIAISEGGINSDTVDRKGLLGTIFASQKTISILDIHDIVSMQRLGKKSQNEVSTTKKNSGKILVIDDSPLYRKILKDLFVESGYEVFLANNGKEGILFLEGQQSVDLVVVDIEMPIMNGWEFCSSIRSSNKKFAKIPIVAVSTRVSVEDREKGVSSGFSEHLEKLNKDEVLKTVNSYVSH